MKIEKCRNCGSNGLVQKDNYEVDDPLTDDVHLRTVLLCLECECVHWREGSSFFYQFIPTVCKSRNFSAAEEYKQ